MNKTHTMKSTSPEGEIVRGCRWRMWLLRVILLAVFMLFHVTTAQWTAQRVAALQSRIHDWWARRSSKAFMAKLEKTTPAHNLESFVATAVAFRDHLKERNIDLTVVLRPETDTILKKGDGLVTDPAAGNGVILKAEAALKKARVKTLNLFPPLHEALSLRPHNAVRWTDGTHLGKPVHEEMCQIISSTLDEKHTRKAGRDIAFAGDCYAMNLGDIFKAGTLLPNIRYFWRNGSTALMPSEISRMPEHELKGLRRIWWLATDDIQKEGEKPFESYPRFQPRVEGSPRSGDAERSLRVTISSAPKITRELEKSPYADALVEYECRTEEGDTFVCLLEVMRNNHIEFGHVWVKDQSYVVRIIPWEAAVAATPKFRHEQIITDIEDLSLPRYSAVGWMHAPE